MCETEDLGTIVSTTTPHKHTLAQLRVWAEILVKLQSQPLQAAVVVVSRGCYGRHVVLVQVHQLRKRLPMLECAQAVAQKT